MYTKRIVLFLTFAGGIKIPLFVLLDDNGIMAVFIFKHRLYALVFGSIDGGFLCTQVYLGFSISIRI